MRTSLRAKIRNEIMRSLKEDLTYPPADSEKTVRPIDPRNIIYSRLPATDRSAIAVPGIILSRSDTKVPPSEATNIQDDWHFGWRIELIGQGTGDPFIGEDSYSLWQERIIDWFHYQRNRFNSIEDAGFEHNHTIASFADDLDEKLWGKDRFVVSAIAMTVVFRRWRRYGKDD